MSTMMSDFLDTKARARLFDVRALRMDERAVLTVSSLAEEAGNPDDVSVSLPRIVGAPGVVTTLCPVMSTGELEAFGRSVKSLQEASKRIRF